VSDWQRHVREHVHEVRDVQKLPGIYEPSGRVIMGRSGHISGAEAKRRWDALKGGGARKFLPMTKSSIRFER